MNQRFFDEIGVSKFPAKMGKEATFWGSIAFACHSWRHLWPCPCFEKGAIRVKKVTRFSIRHKTTFSAAQAAFSGKHTKKPSSLNKETFTNFCNADAVQQSSPFQLGLRQWKTFFNFQRLLSFGDSWHAVLQGLKLWRNKVFQFRSHLKFFLKHYFHIFSTANSVLEEHEKNFGLAFELKASFYWHGRCTTTTYCSLSPSLQRPSLYTPAWSLKSSWTSFKPTQVFAKF